MIVVAQTVWIGSGLILAGWLYWLSARAQADRNALEELIDRADQILGDAPTVVMPAVATTRPQPAPGPATVPTGQAIETAYRAMTTGRHARSE